MGPEKGDDRERRENGVTWGEGKKGKGEDGERE